MTLILTTLALAQDFRIVEEVLLYHHKRLFPEAALMVGSKNSDLFSAFPSSSPQRIYDLASLTKVVATATSIMILVDRKVILLKDPVSKFHPAFTQNGKDDVTVEDLLRHQSGLASGMRPLPAEKFEDYLQRLVQAPLSYKPRSKTLYSDLSAIVLGYIVEVASGKKLNEFAEENIFRPLQMSHTTFSAREIYGNQCAATSRASFCVVHDPTARGLLPEALGNAGVFGSAVDLAKFARMILNEGELDGVRVLSAEAVKTMTTGKTRALGWDLVSEYSNAPRGEYFPAGISFGHTGYTGTTLWIDPRSKTYYVFLSNRVLQSDSADFRASFSRFRRDLSSAIGAAVSSRSWPDSF